MGISRCFRVQKMWPASETERVVDVLPVQGSLIVQLGRSSGMKYVKFEPKSGELTDLLTSKRYLQMKEAGQWMCFFNEEEVCYRTLEDGCKVRRLEWENDFKLGPLAHKVAIIGNCALLRTERGVIEVKRLSDPSLSVLLYGPPGWGIRGGIGTENTITLSLSNLVSGGYIGSWDLRTRKRLMFELVSANVTAVDPPVVVGASPGLVTVDSLQDGKQISQFRTDRSFYNSKMQLSWPKMVLSGRTKNRVVYDLERQKEIYGFHSNSPPLLTDDYLIYSKTGRSFVCDINTGRLLHKLKGEVLGAGQMGKELFLARGPLGLTKLVPRPRLEKKQTAHKSPTTKLRIAPLA